MVQLDSICNQVAKLTKHIDLVSKSGLFKTVINFSFETSFFTAKNTNVFFKNLIFRIL